MGHYGEMVRTYDKNNADKSLKIKHEIKTKVDYEECVWVGGGGSVKRENCVGTRHARGDEMVEWEMKRKWDEKRERYW